MEDLTEVEERLVAAVESGTALDLDEGVKGGPKVFESWGAEREVRASVIREIMRGKLAVDADPRGLILKAAKIVGRLDLRHVESSVVLNLSNCYLPAGGNFKEASLRSVTLDYCILGSSLIMTATVVDGFLLARNLTMHTKNTSCLHADRLTVKQSMDLSNSDARSDGACSGVIRMTNCNIGNDLLLQGAEIAGENSSCLMLDGAQVAGSLRMNDMSAKTSGSAIDGAVRLVSADVRGQLSFDRATIVNGDGAAINADRLRVGASVFLDDMDASSSSQDISTIRLLGAEIGSQLRAPRCTVTNTKGSAISADRMLVHRGLYLDNDFVVRGAGKQGVLRIPGVTVETLYIDLAGIEHLDGGSELLYVDGLTYKWLPRRVDLDSWLNALSTSTTEYASQPFQQLAASARAAGHDGDVTRILIAQRRSQIKRSAVTGAGRVRTQLLGVTLGFGYQPWRALIGLMLIAGVAVGLSAFVGGRHDGLEKKGAAVTSVAVPCAKMDQVGFGFEIGLPLVKAARSSCQPRANHAGNILTAAGWILQTASWAFATLFIAGFTGIVRKS